MFARFEGLDPGLFDGDDNEALEVDAPVQELAPRFLESTPGSGGAVAVSTEDGTTFCNCVKGAFRSC